MKTRDVYAVRSRDFFRIEPALTLGKLEDYVIQNVHVETKSQTVREGGRAGRRYLFRNNVQEPNLKMLLHYLTDVKVLTEVNNLSPGIKVRDMKRVKENRQKVTCYFKQNVYVKCLLGKVGGRNVFCFFDKFSFSEWQHGRNVVLSRLPCLSTHR